ncbi:topoisomerase IV subunit A [Escherichia coli]|uniref:Topoisomerase IV subunit A n=1 Tax=Escherichia coli TaxID=562 RepID=A0A377DLI3_ECOLX|nr:topoisomerase IV subunit A [Escherichia coli]
MLMESDDQKLLMASDAGYGFVCTFNDLVARNRAGKALITLPENAHVMPPVVIEDASDMLLAITQAGRMLMFPVSDLPQLSKGKGNKIINIPSAEAARGEDGLAQLYVSAAAKHADHSCWENAKLNCARKSYRKSLANVDAAVR